MNSRSAAIHLEWDVALDLLEQCEPLERIMLRRC